MFTYSYITLSTIISDRCQTNSSMGNVKFALDKQVFIKKIGNVYGNLKDHSQLKLDLGICEPLSYMRTLLQQFLEYRP